MRKALEYLSYIAAGMLGVILANVLGVEKALILLGILITIWFIISIIFYVRSKDVRAR